VLRLFLLFNLSFLTIFACSSGYPTCQKKLQDSNSISKNQIQLLVKKHQRLLYSTTIPKKNIIKYDQFLSLYLIEDKKGFAYPFRFARNSANVVGAINNTTISKGTVTKPQIGLSTLGSFSDPSVKSALLSTGCCDVDGFVTPDGVIEREYLEHFLKSKSKSNSYSDVGIRVKQDEQYVIVTAVDPYVKSNPFLEDDCILKHNGKKVKNAAALMQKILFSQEGVRQIFQVKRGDKIVNLAQKTKIRFGGGYVSDTFLERFGIYVDEELKIVRLSENYKGNSLKVCDKLIQIDDKRVHNQHEVMQTISAQGKVTSLLIQRDNFQFFVKLN
jgi:hypothetical protein